MKNSITKSLVGLSPTFMHFLLIASLLLCCVVDVFDYSNLFGKSISSVGTALGLGFAVFIQCLRLGSALDGIKSFQDGNKLAGYFGLIFSFVLSIYVSIHYIDIAARWSAANPDLEHVIKLVLQCMVWSGFSLEVRMVMGELGSVEKVRKPSKKKSKKRKTADEVKK